MLLAGEGTVDITPPAGTVLAGFHYSPGKERRATGARMPTHARALYLQHKDTAALLLSVDIIGFAQPVCERIAREAGAAAGVLPAHVFVTATHTHSSPSLVPLLQWGEVSPEYTETVVRACVDAAKAARNDAAEADFYLGTERVAGGNMNRTVKAWKTDADFGPDASDQERWLDTLLQVMYFLRGGGKPALAWYHFSAHPVCYQDTLTGPDWPGIVAEKIHAADNVRPSYLQGHIGDVNPGDGTKWIGDPEPTAVAIGSALHHAMGHSQLIEIDEMRATHATATLPFDLKRFQDDLAFFRDHADQCTRDTWVDADFAKAWHARAQQWDLQRGALDAPLAALRIGPVALLFHPAELYSFYGLQIRTRSPFPHTLLTGLAGGEIGYLTDPAAYTSNEYAAIVVPKILELPPFAPGAAAILTERIIELAGTIA